MIITAVNKKGNQLVVTYYKTNDAALESGISISEDNLREFAEDGSTEGVLDMVDHEGNHIQDNYQPDYEDISANENDLKELIKEYVRQKVS